MGIISYAQNFEDVMLWRAFSSIKNGFYIDIGAHDPIIDSVSKAFYEKGWRGIHVDPLLTYTSLLKSDRPDEIVIQAAIASKSGTMEFYEIPHTGISTGDANIAQKHQQSGFDVNVIKVQCLSLSEIFDFVKTDDVHWMKVDVEGMEQQVLQGWGDCKLRPWIVVIESTLPLTQVDASKDWEHLLFDKGYSQVYFDGLNRFYLSSEHLELACFFESPPNVFDDFTLNGTANASFCRKIQSEKLEILAKNEIDIAVLQSEMKGSLEKLQNQYESNTLQSNLKQITQLEEKSRVIESLGAQLDVLHNESRQIERELRANLEKTLEQQLEGQKTAALIERDLTTRLDKTLEQQLEDQKTAANEVKALNATNEQLRISLAQHVKFSQALQASWLWRRGGLFRRLSGTYEEPLLTDVIVNKPKDFKLMNLSSEKQFMTNTVLDNTQYIYMLYQRLLNRKPDAEGLTHYQQRFAEGFSRNQVLSEIVRSWEVKVRLLKKYQLNPKSYPNADDIRFLEMAYQAILGRAPDAGGLSNFLSLFGSGVSRKRILLAISASPEARSHQQEFSANLKWGLRQFQETKWWRRLSSTKRNEFSDIREGLYRLESQLNDKYTEEVNRKYRPTTEIARSLYLAILKREANAIEYEGLRFQLANGFELKDIINTIINSDEFQRKFVVGSNNAINSDHSDYMKNEMDGNKSGLSLRENSIYVRLAKKRVQS